MAMKFKKKWVLVTGASSGLGYEMAVQFAKKHRANLVLVARRKEKLEALQQRLISDYHIKCEVITADLSVDEEVVKVFEQATKLADIYAVVLNAGVTYFGKHTELPWSQFETMLNTNVKSVVRLTNLFVPYLQAQKGKGGIMFVASMAGLVPVPYQSAYAGTKGFLTNFGMSLHQELSGSAVSLTVYAPGGIDTELTRNSKLDYFSDSGLLQTAEECAADGIAAFKARKMLKVPGKMNQAQILLSRLAPRKLLTTITGVTYKHALKNAD